MADAAKVRRWANDNGRGANRGALGKTLIADWDQAHPDDPYESGVPRGEATGTAPDYPDDDFDSLFPDAGPPVTGGTAGPGTGDMGETAPSRPKARARARAAGASKWPFSKAGKPGGAKAKKKTPRVSTEDLLGSVWRAGAKLASPLPPLQRTLRLQAPVAGLLLEDAVKDTLLDPILQPLARIAESGKTIQALVGPPGFVTAIMVHQMQTAKAGEEPNPLFMAIATEGLRSSLMAWMDVAGPKFEVALAREQEFEAQYGGRVDDVIAMIFAMPVDPGNAEAVMAEDDAIRRAQGIL